MGKERILQSAGALLIGIAAGVIATRLSFLALTAVGLVFLVAATAWFPKMSLILLPYGIFLWSKLLEVGVFNVIFLDILLGMQYLYVFYRFKYCLEMAEQQALWRESFRLIVVAWIPLLFSLFGATISVDSSAALKSLLFIKRWAEYSVMPLAFLLLADGTVNKRVERGLLIVNLIFFLSIVFGFSMPDSGAAEVGDDNPFGDRAVGLFFNPNVAGIVSVMLFNSYLWRFLQAKKRLQLIRSAILMAVNLACLAASGSREAMVGLIAGAVLWLLVAGAARRKYVSTLFLMTLIFVVVLFGTPMGAVMVERGGEALSQGAKSENVSTRMESQQIGLQLIAQHPQGIGVGNIEIVSKEALFKSDASFKYMRGFENGITTTDNQLVDMLLELGILGGAAFTWCLVLMYRLASQLRIRDLQVNIIVVTIVGMAASTFSIFFISSLLWLSLASGFAAQNKGEQADGI